MEYCPNGTFFDILHNNLPVTIDNIIDWTQQIAQGMNYLHSHKVVHRDLKSPKWVLSSSCLFWLIINLPHSCIFIPFPQYSNRWRWTTEDIRFWRIERIHRKFDKNVLCWYRCMDGSGDHAWRAMLIQSGCLVSLKYPSNLGLILACRSFGVIVWEILTCEVPFNGVDCGAIIYGIASNLFCLPIPTACPTEFRVLMKRCW